MADVKKIAPIVPFLEKLYTLPSGEHVLLTDHQKTLLRFMFTPDDTGKLRFRQVVWSCPKKCKDIKDLVLLATGEYVSIGSLINKEVQVVGYDKTTGDIETTVATGSDNGLDYVVSIKTYGGHEFTETVETPVFTQKGWIRADQVCMEDWVAIPCWSPTPKKTTDISDDELVFLAGIIAEGCTIDTCTFTNNKGVYLDRFLTAAKNLGFQVKFQKPLAYSVSGARNILRKYDLYNKLSHEKKIPLEVFRMSNRSISLFLSFLFGGDGCFNAKGTRIQYSSLSKELCEQIILLLRRFGIYASLEEEACDGRHVDRTYKVDIACSEDRESFLKEIGIFGKSCPTKRSEKPQKACGSNALPALVATEAIRVLKNRNVSLRRYSGLINRGEQKAYNKRSIIEALQTSGGIPFHLLPYINANTVWIKVKQLCVSNSPVPTASIEVPRYGAFLGKNIAANSGKTAIGAMVAAWYAFSGLAERRDEIICVANDLEQSMGRHFKSFKEAIESSDVLRGECNKIYEKVVETKNGTTISAIASDFAGAAGSNPGLTLFDELWAFTNEKSRRLFEELTPPPTRRNGLRMITTYAGFVAESELLENIYKRVVKEENLVDLGSFPNAETGIITKLPVYVSGDTCVYWDHEPRLPWQTAEYYFSEMNQPGFRWSAFRRIHRNEWIEAEEGLDIRRWEACVDEAIKANYMQPAAPDGRMSIGIGVDCSLVKDRTAVVTCFKRDGRLWLGPYQTWQPSQDQPLNFENTVEKYLLELYPKYFISAIYYDPWQFESSAQRLRDRGLPMYPWPQTQPNTIKMTELLLDKLNERGIVLYPDESMKDEAKMVSVKEIPGRGRRFVKDNKNKKIDTIIALSMAALATNQHCPDYESMKDQLMFLKLKRR